MKKTYVILNSLIYKRRRKRAKCPCIERGPGDFTDPDTLFKHDRVQRPDVRISAIEVKQHKKFVPYISIKLGKNVKPLDWMLDSGSEVNIIRLGFVPPEYRINDKIVYNLQGIGANSIQSLGILKICRSTA